MILTTTQVQIYSDRMDEIMEIVEDKSIEDKDKGLYELEIEMDEIVIKLDKSWKLTRIKESNLRLII